MADMMFDPIFRVVAVQDAKAAAERPIEPALGGERLLRAAAPAQARIVRRALESESASAARAVLQLQKSYGNRYAARVVAAARESVDRFADSGLTLQRKMTVSQPGDPYEREADETARRVAQQEHQFAPAQQDEPQRQPERGDEEEKKGLAR